MSPNVFQRFFKTSEEPQLYYYCFVFPILMPVSWLFFFAELGKKSMLRAAELAVLADGISAPHPRSGCVILGTEGDEVAKAFQRGQGGVPSEVLALDEAGDLAQGSSVYVNLEPRHGLAAGDDETVAALVRAGVARVVVGLRHPVPQLRGQAIHALREAGVQVYVLGDAYGEGGAGAAAAEAAAACRLANEALLHRIATGVPFSVFKYAMTLDGKIATASGHSAWVSGPLSRELVWAERRRSDAIIVGGATVRNDNPHLTTRQDTGHFPMRVVLSRSLDLPEEANLWDTSVASTLVMTQRGARRDFQEYLRVKGVEVIEFDFLEPSAVVNYFAHRGCLQLMWECGGTLAAPALSASAVHKVMAFIAPKVIGGGSKAKSPIGELGFVEMTQALPLVESNFDKVGDDLLFTGYLPSSGGLAAAAAAAAAAPLQPSSGGRITTAGHEEQSVGARVRALPAIQGELRGDGDDDDGGDEDLDMELCTAECEPEPPAGSQHLRFYKAWDAYGALSNFAPFPIDMQAEDGTVERWPTVEHYYQAYKFAGVDLEGSRATYEAVRTAATPEEAAWRGRRAMNKSPQFVNPAWAEQKFEVMYRALEAKFRQHPGPRRLLLETSRMGEVEEGGLALFEDAPHDAVW
ncbi:hypothetical protein CYMTET_19228 [Cymbomonas tetramitiformis]|uniref:5-amino-6-(5-phosphoribosylamino)uracil reductase n=1 Tax=Cymbomonas tetramitiformis TaxID=36881 RepID=A0AAE0L5F5_9CHLO|nr:hypothetical protein CYMTET_19228 [Cymbomonas tetramitiformis]